VRREWELEDLIECWMLDEAEFELLANKTGSTRLGFALMLKFFEQEARFPQREDVPKAAVEFVSGQVKVDAALFAEYSWSGRTIEYHRAQIREFHQFREPTVGDEDRLIAWLAGDMCPVETTRDRVRGALLARCRAERTEPPSRAAGASAGRGRSLVRAAVHRDDDGVFGSGVDQQAGGTDRCRRPGRARW
jgi:uncharacterized protein DUF4158